MNKYKLWKQWMIKFGFRVSATGHALSKRNNWLFFRSLIPHTKRLFRVTQIFYKANDPQELADNLNNDNYKLYLIDEKGMNRITKKYAYEPNPNVKSPRIDISR